MNREIGTTRSGLRLGYTTGSCAAAAAKAGTQMLLSREEIRQVRLMTPKGIELYLDVESITRTKDYVECAVRKYSGDDPDVTDGLLIFARVEKVKEAAPKEQRTELDQIILEGGHGVGRVTKPGLEQAVGQAAINQVPRRMIREAVCEICREYKCSDVMKVTIFIPEGAETARKTFNPRLGIEGGLSILGTTGIVEPMSEKALTDTIYLEMKMKKENGISRCCVVPGNYGSDFLEKWMHVDASQAVKCSNYIGETLDDARLLGMKGILLIGHVGKFIKLAAGVMNTHSRQADCRMEVLAAHAAMAGADGDTVCRIMACINTSEVIGILREKQILPAVMKTVMEKISWHLEQRSAGKLDVEAILYSEEGILGKTPGADRLLEEILGQDEGGAEER